MKRRHGTSKRELLGLIALAAGAAIAPQGRLAAADDKLAAADDKMSKQQAEYQDSPQGIAMCATCTLFVAPHSCKVVDGDVSPNGWCKVYAMAD